MSKALLVAVGEWNTVTTTISDAIVGVIGDPTVYLDKGMKYFNSLLLPLIEKAQGFLYEILAWIYDALPWHSDHLEEPSPIELEDTGDTFLDVAPLPRAGATQARVPERVELSGGRPLAPHERSLAMYAPFLAVLDVDIPVIGALNGHAVGGGFGLALCCDLRIGAREGRYGANFARLGLHPGMAITHLLPRLVGVANAADLLFTGRLVDGDEAQRIGLLGEVVAAADVPARARAVAELIAANAPGPLRTIKRALDPENRMNPGKMIQTEG